MLELKQITKEYKMGDTKVKALKGVDIAFRKCEFAAILGPSGCGKTTLLNIIGGLDQYTEGDLVINGRSTKSYKDHDWDGYRNHSIGFVFQSYNLIPHQTVLKNVELALTLSGVSKGERRYRAKEALEKVGLGDQLKKKPSQMSGGQMQRVAIARALVNDPDILLADEPTGALDSETSLQVMEILKEISKEKLVIMVTHNPELADNYATRIVKLLDGKVVSDSDPYTADAHEQKKNNNKKKPSMGFLTALSLSLNNLMTKKGRTILTAFAGSIGIIGIALILALSSGVNAYIERVERDTLSSYPLMIEKQSVDMTGLMEAMMGAAESAEEHPLDKVYSGQMMTRMMSGMMSEVQQNNLSAFKVYLDAEETGLDQYISGIRYDYATPLTMYRILDDGRPMQVNPSTTFQAAGFGDMMNMSASSEMISTSMRQMDAFQPLLDNQEMLHSQYDVVYGRFPEAYDEVVVIVNDRNEISDFTLYSLGMRDQGEIAGMMANLLAGKSIDPIPVSFTYEEIMGMTFYLMDNTDFYQKKDGVWVDMRHDEDFVLEQLKTAPVIRVVGILRPADDAVATSVAGGIGYRPELMYFLLDRVNNSQIVQEQLAAQDTDIFTGLAFADVGEAQPAVSQGDMQAVMAAFDPQQQAVLATMTPQQIVTMGMLTPEQMRVMAAMPPQQLAMMAALTPEQQAMMAAMPPEQLMMMTSMSLDDLALVGSIPSEYQTVMATFTPEQMAMAATLTQEQQAIIAQGMPADMLQPGQAVPTSDATLEENLKLLGVSSEEDPSTIYIYPKDFESKEQIVALINSYNASVDEEDQIRYTDYVGLMMSSVTNIVNAISYILIAFVAISLVVSSIMIGIITYISVLERTKEIGILRAIGASKRDISRVFNAETLIVGFTAGLFGIGATLLLIQLVNAIILSLTSIRNAAGLPFNAALILVGISMLLTFIAGLIPSRLAAKKDPVVALRTE